MNEITRIGDYKKVLHDLSKDNNIDQDNLSGLIRLIEPYHHNCSNVLQVLKGTDQHISIVQDTGAEDSPLGTIAEKELNDDTKVHYIKELATRGASFVKLIDTSETEEEVEAPKPEPVVETPTEEVEAPKPEPTQESESVAIIVEEEVEVVDRPAPKDPFGLLESTAVKIEPVEELSWLDKIINAVRNFFKTNF